jgi:4-hydroxybenzoate polyprenyltransferase
MRRLLKTIYELLDTIKVGHSVLALPFAFMGAMLAARGFPPLRTAGYILVAMVTARSAAMAFNRLADAAVDAANPRTAARSLPAGRLSRRATIIFVALNSLIFIWAAAQLNRVCFALSPLVLAVILGYSLTKRFTWASHLILGFSLALAPLGGWLAVRGDLGLPVLVLSVGVLFWVAGFDILYALQDEEVDRHLGLFSLPARVGARIARHGAVLCHLLAVVGFALTGWLAGLGRLYTLAVIFSALILATQHFLLARRAAIHLPPAFFTLNGLISVCLGLATWISLTF